MKATGLHDDNDNKNMIHFIVRGNKDPFRVLPDVSRLSMLLARRGIGFTEANFGVDALQTFSQQAMYSSNVKILVGVEGN